MSRNSWGLSSAGCRNRDIAADLGVSETTVKSHRAKAMRKEADLIRKRIAPPPELMQYQSIISLILCDHAQSLTINRSVPFKERW